MLKAYEAQQGILWETTNSTQTKQIWAKTRSKLKSQMPRRKSCGSWPLLSFLLWAPYNNGRSHTHSHTNQHCYEYVYKKNLYLAYITHIYIKLFIGVNFDGNLHFDACNKIET